MWAQSSSVASTFGTNQGCLAMCGSGPMHSPLGPVFRFQFSPAIGLHAGLLCGRQSTLHRGNRPRWGNRFPARTIRPNLVSVGLGGFHGSINERGCQREVFSEGYGDRFSYKAGAVALFSAEPGGDRARQAEEKIIELKLRDLRPSPEVRQATVRSAAV